MGEPQATGVTSNGASTVVTRDQLLAELESGALDADDAPAPAKAKPPVEEPVEPEPDVEAAAEGAEPTEPTEPDTAEPDEDADSDEDDDDEDVLAAKDPETAKRLATVRKQEQRAREAIAAERRAFERERAEYQRETAADREAVREFTAMRERFRYDPMGVIRALGASEDDYETIGRAVYAHSKKGAADPRNKEAVERSLKEREQQDKLDALQKRLDAREAAENKAREEAAAAREATKYVDGVAKAVSAKTPLASHFLEKNPERTKARLGQIAYDLAGEMDTLPTPAQVLKAYERIRREELLELGVDPATLVKAKAKTAEATKAGKTAAKQTESDKPPTKDELLAEIEAGRFD